MIHRYLTAALLMPVLLAETGPLSAQKGSMTKRDYYNTYVAPQKGRPPIKKILGFEDRKRSVFDVGNLVLRFSNAAILGYDRWGLNHEFPAGSMAKDQCCTYYWTLSPMIGGLLKGQPSVAVGVRGTLRDSEEEFEPLPGYDADLVDEQNNIGIAFNDKPGSWPVKWPIEIDPTGTYTDAVSKKTFVGLERPLDLDHPDGSGLRFPGVLDGKAAAPREAYFVVTENDPLEGNTLESNGIGPLNVRVDMWGLQYDDILNQDFIIWWQRFTNVGPDTLYEVFVGLAGDPDTPEQGGAEWTDDYSLFIERGDPLIAEKLADTTDSRLLWDLAVIWDGNDQAEGFISSGVAWVGLKALKTPNTRTADGIDNDWDGLTDEGFDGLDNDGDGEIDEDDEQEEMGITNYFPFPYSLDAQSDNEAYFTQIRSGFGHNSPTTGYQESPHADDIEQKPYAYGPDITVVMTSGPFTLRPGESLDFVFADIVGVNELDLLNNARTAQQLFDAGFKAPKPPDEPVVHGVAGDREISLYWDAYPSEYSIDPFTGNNAFEGYRIYKSTDRGATWGESITDARGNSVFFKPQAVYDVANEWSGPHAYGSPAAYYDLGTNSGVKYTYTDKNVINGVEYWFAVSAFDHPDGVVPPLENPPKKARSEALASGNNTVVLVPQARQAGFTPGGIELKHLVGRSTANLAYTVYDAARLGNYTYLVSVMDDLDATDDTTKSISVLNTHVFSDTVEIAITGTELDHFNIKEGSVSVTGDQGEQYEEGVDFTVDLEAGKIYSLEDGDLARLRGKRFTVSYTYYPIYQSTLLAGEDSAPTFEGIRLLVEDVEDVMLDSAATAWQAGTSNWTTALSDAGDKANADDYEIRFTGTSAVLNGANAFVPLEIWNVSDTVEAAHLIVVPPPAPGTTATIESLENTKITAVEVPNFETELATTWEFHLLPPDPATVEDIASAGVLCDTTRSGNGVFDWNDENEDGVHDADEFGEAFIDLDGSGTWDEGEPFVDCGFDTASALADLYINMNQIIPGLKDSLSWACASPDLDTTIITTLFPRFQFDPQTQESDTLRGLRFKATLLASCDLSLPPSQGDVLFVGTTKPLTPEDTYLLQTTSSTAVVTGKIDLEGVKVVPNPYVATSAYETNIETKELQFHHLPEICTIRIFTLAGELVQILKHQPGSKGWRGPSTEAWDLRTYNNQEVAFGIYLFHVEARGENSRGETKSFSETGKFAVIR